MNEDGGWTLGLEDAQRFVCRTDTRRTCKVAGTLTGFEFGSRKTNTFLAPLDDKTVDMATKDAGWWPAVWSKCYVPGARVYRLEFEIGRQAWSSFDLNAPRAVLSLSVVLGETVEFRVGANSSRRQRRCRRSGHAGRNGPRGGGSGETRYPT